MTITIAPASASVCSISAGTVSFTAAGTCVIDANQVGNSTYSAAPQVQQSFAVAKASQTISWSSSAPTAAVYGGTYTPTATASSGLAPAITVDPSSVSVCSITAGTVSYLAPGTCTLDANQVGSADYLAAPQVQQSFAVAAKPAPASSPAGPTGSTSTGTTGSGPTSSGTSTGTTTGTGTTSTGTAPATSTTPAPAHPGRKLPSCSAPVHPATPVFAWFCRPSAVTHVHPGERLVLLVRLGRSVVGRHILTVRPGEVLGARLRAPRRTQDLELVTGRTQLSRATLSPVRRLPLCSAPVRPARTWTLWCHLPAGHARAGETVRIVFVSHGRASSFRPVRIRTGDVIGARLRAPARGTLLEILAGRRRLAVARLLTARAR